MSTNPHIATPALARQRAVEAESMIVAYSRGLPEGDYEEMATRVNIAFWRSELRQAQAVVREAQR